MTLSLAVGVGALARAGEEQRGLQAQSILLCWEIMGRRVGEEQGQGWRGGWGRGRGPHRRAQAPVSFADTGPPPPLMSQPPSCRVDLPPPHYFCSTAPTGPPVPTPAEGVAVAPTVPVPAPYHRLEGALGPRSRSDSAERRPEPPATSAEDYHEADSARSRTRAVENQYSFY